MARTVNEIYNVILTNKAARVELAQLDSTSQTAVWKIWAYITALAHHVLERIFDAHKVEINNLLVSQQVHTGRWYQQLALNFQYDSEIEQILIVDNFFRAYYAVTDETKRIITRASVREASRRLYVKVNKGNVPNLSVLSESEMSSFVSYINLMKDAGTQVVVQSFPVEKLIAKLEVDYSPSEGIVTALQVKDMLDDYLSNLDFDGVVSVQSLEARVLSDPRVRNIKVVYLLATQNDDTPISEFFNLNMGINNKVYSSVAGHIILNRDLSEIIINAV